jgi:hypothetical protein
MTKEIALPTGYQLKETSVSLSLRWSLVLALGLLPVYTFASGGFQVVDLPLVLLILLSFYLPNTNDIYARQVKRLLPFISWALLVNITYFAIYGDMGYLRAVIIITYTLLLLFFFMKIYQSILEQNKVIYIYLGLFLSIILTFVTKGPPDEEGRAVLSFNDPNQLGYFASIMLAYAIILLKYKEITNNNRPILFLFDGILVFFAHLFILYALSRSAMAAFFILDLCLIKGLRNIKIISAIIICIILMAGYILIFNPHFFSQRLEVRDPSHYSLEEMVQGLDSRVMDPVRRMSGLQYLVGKGQGAVFSYRSSGEGGRRGYGGESHNVFGEIFRGYGAIGLLLFLVWLFKAVWISRVLPEALWVWAGLLMYNIGNYGFRFRAFWIFLALMMVVCRMAANMKNKIS